MRPGPRLLAIVACCAAGACAGVLGLDPGTLREAPDAGVDAAVDAGEPVEAGPRGCANALGEGIYCDDFDEPGRTDPGAREGKMLSGDAGIELSTAFFRSAPRSLKVSYRGAMDFPRAYLTLPRTLDGAFHLRMAIRVVRGASPNTVIVAELAEVAGREGVTYAIALDPRESGIELSLREASLALTRHPKTFSYDEWHTIEMRFRDRYAYIELDGESVSAGVPVVEGDYDVHFGLQSYAPVTVYLDDVEIGTAR